MSFRSKPSSTRRSQSFHSSSSPNNTVPGLASYNRPRSLNIFNTNTPTIPSTHYGGYSSSPTSYLHSKNTPSVLNNYSYNAFNPYSKYNGYSSHHTTPSLGHQFSNYGGTTTGYGGLSVPSKTLSALNIMPSSKALMYSKNYDTKNYEPKNYDTKNYELKNYDNNRDYSTKTTNQNNEKTRQSRSKSRNGGSFSRSRSHSAVRDSGMGSRSRSLSSLNSEGYAVSIVENR